MHFYEILVINYCLANFGVSTDLGFLGSEPIKPLILKYLFLIFEKVLSANSVAGDLGIVEYNNGCMSKWHRD